MYYIYILKCSDNSFYTGITTDLERRKKEHNGEMKGGAKYTRGRRPVEVIYFEEVENKSLASKREIEIKNLTKKQKLDLINKNMKKFKTREDYQKNVKYMDKNNCPFCKGKVEKEHNILFETDYWLVIESLYPYFDEPGHLIVIPKKHREFTRELSKLEFGDFKEVEVFMKKHFGEKEYFSFIRQSKGNKSVEHLHYHFLVGKPSAKNLGGEKYFKIKD